jgi:hypothetical protein
MEYKKSIAFNERPIRQVVEIEKSDLDILLNGMRKLDSIEAVMQSVKLIDQPEYLTAPEFMEKAKMSRWKFDAYRNLGTIKTKTIGRKLYVPISELTRYFAGELEGDHK